MASAHAHFSIRTAPRAAEFPAQVYKSKMWAYRHASQSRPYGLVVRNHPVRLRLHSLRPHDTGRRRQEPGSSLPQRKCSPVQLLTVGVLRCDARTEVRSRLTRRKSSSLDLITGLVLVRFDPRNCKVLVSARTQRRGFFFYPDFLLYIQCDLFSSIGVVGVTNSFALTKYVGCVHETFSHFVHWNRTTRVSICGCSMITSPKSDQHTRHCYLKSRVATLRSSQKKKILNTHYSQTSYHLHCDYRSAHRCGCSKQGKSTQTVDCFVTSHTSPGELHRLQELSRQ